MKLPYVKAEADEMTYDLTDIGARLTELAKAGHTFQPKASKLFGETKQILDKAIEKLKEIELL